MPTQPDNIPNVEAPDLLNESLAKAQRDGNIVETPHSMNDDRQVKCYNRSCPDYGVWRRWDQPCGCKRTRVVGAGV